MIILSSMQYLPQAGGVSIHVYELAKGLVSQGQEVAVITSANMSSKKALKKEEGITVYRVKNFTNPLSNFHDLRINHFTAIFL